MDATFKQQIDTLLAQHKVVVFMKGAQTMPQCGFSARVVQIFNTLGVAFHDVDILANEQIRTEMKTYSNWPTFPQVYINGEFVGGCDIVTEMYEKGELQPLVSA
ncbi:MAG: Grx4 family monothiol glutaredoxin [Deltaproteobacteria bacterium]|nr:Grx4 family monothiol glutaredoxin [Deltaproteobacteria bacterium]